MKRSRRGLSKEEWLSWLNEEIMATYGSSWDDWIGAEGARLARFGKRLQEWVWVHEEPFKERAQALSQRIRYIPITEFLTKFGASVKWVQRQLQAAGADKFYVAGRPSMEPGLHSRAWTSDIARDVLKHYTYAGQYVKSNKRVGARDRPVHVCIFDDAMYTGSQVVNTLKCIGDEIYKIMELGTKGEGEPTKTYSEPIVHIYVVIPFATLHALEAVKRQVLESSCYKIQFANACRLGAVKLHVYDVPECDVLPSAKALKELNIFAYASCWNCALTVFDHKVPDHLSFPGSLRCGEPVDDGVETYTRIQSYSVSDVAERFAENDMTLSHIEEFRQSDETKLEAANRAFGCHGLACKRTRPFLPIYDAPPYKLDLRRPLDWRVYADPQSTAEVTAEVTAEECTFDRA
jgi:hypothetical protein